MEIKRYSMDIEGLNEEMNKGKELFVRSMYDSGVITAQQYEVMQGHSIAVARKGFFGSLWDRVFKKNDSAYYFVVKVVSPTNPDMTIKPEEEDDGN